MGLSERIKRIENSLLCENVFSSKGYITASLQERMLHYKVPGVSIAVINGHRVEWANGYGTKEVGTDDLVDESTLFQAASMSKSVASLGVMRLVYQGILDLDEDVNSYLKSWKVPSNDMWSPRITLRQILSHTAGLTTHGFRGYKVSENIPNHIQVLNGEPPANSAAVLVDTIPGLQYRYSGGGYSVAQQIVADVLGIPFPQAMKELVLDPLEMKNSTFEQHLPPGRVSSAAAAHTFTDKPVEGKWHIYPEMAAAGLWTTPYDLAVFGSAAQLALKGEGPDFLKCSVTEMLTPQVENHYGLGFRLRGTGPASWFGHRGSNEGFRSSMLFNKGLGIGFVIMMNSWRDDLLSEIERAIASVYEWPDLLPPEKTACFLNDSVFDLYGGTYQTDNGLKIAIISMGGSLGIQVGLQPTIVMYPTSQTEFYLKEVNAKVNFILSPDGIAEKLVIQQNGSKVECMRLS